MTHPTLERLVAMASAEQEAITDVSRAVRHLEETQAAKVQLQGLPAEVIRAARQVRAWALVGKGRA